MAKKWADPLDKLLEADGKANDVKSYLSAISCTQDKSKLSTNKTDSTLIESKIEIIELDVTDIDRWEFKDRPEDEIGNIEELAQTFKSIGQQQPCVVRKSKKSVGRYEIIVGERRWRAAEIAGLKLKVIIQDIDDRTAALIQAVENEKREDISDFAKGMSYADKIEKKLISQKDLIELLGISKQQVSRLLSYKNIPKELFDSVRNFKKVSARTASELARLANKSPEHLSILIEMSDKIREGKLGQKRLEKELYERINKTNNPVPSKQKIHTDDGRHIFTWRLDNNSSPSVHFPNDIIKLIRSNEISFDQITKEIKECIEKNLHNIKSQSPRGD
jgi:ParB family transcriptional regulator, chromosome partitioning protein